MSIFSNLRADMARLRSWMKANPELAEAREAEICFVIGANAVASFVINGRFAQAGWIAVGWIILLMFYGVNFFKAIFFPLLGWLYLLVWVFEHHFYVDQRMLDMHKRLRQT